MNNTTDLQRYIHISKYSKYLDTKKRRETWQETVDRYIDFWAENPKTKGLLSNEDLEDMRTNIYNCKAMPSMRALMTAGKALTRDNLAGYNCAFVNITHPRCFDELFFLSLCAVGVGFSVAREHIAKLPEVSEDFHDTDTTIVVRDSKIGWATGLKELIGMLYNGQIPQIDVSKVRPAGARLKTFGGRASGPEPLVLVYDQIINIFRNAKGRKLQSVECHDICCHIMNSVIVGGVRRSASISLSNLTDNRMRRAKDGDWWRYEPQRELANNSVAYTEKPDIDSFSKEWRTQHKSKSGERGIINMEALIRKALQTNRETSQGFGINPCGEAILRATGGLCNLTEQVLRPDDTYDEVLEKLRVAVIMGTAQSTLTDFRYVRAIWKTNAEEERLLGVSLTGIMDNKIFSNRASSKYIFEWSNGACDSLESLLDNMKRYARSVNATYAKLLGINPAGQITLVKPSGTVSLLVDSSSGIHPREGKFYIRRARQDMKDPLTQLLMDQGVPYVIADTKVIFSFFVKSPQHALVQKDVGALQQLELWKIYSKHWCEGNPSQTISYTDDEYFAIADWIWKNWDDVVGLSFFPKDDHIYTNPPLEEITREQYNKFIKTFPKNISWDDLPKYEKEDETSTNELGAACSGAQGCAL